MSSPKLKNIQGKNKIAKVQRAAKQQTETAETAVSPLSTLQRAFADPNNIGVNNAKALQRTFGNQAVRRAMQQTVIQRKMTVGPVDDEYEQEADAVAKQVMQTASTPKSLPVQRQEEDEELQMKPLPSAIPSPSVSILQRQEDDEELQLKPFQSNLPPFPFLQREEEDEELQAKGNSISAGGELNQDLENSVQQAKSGGQPLGDNVRGTMEQAFNADFNSVKIHTGSTADTLNRSLSARAFTSGQDVFFRSGQYNPDSSAGQELLAHELTHTIQQGAVTTQGKENRVQTKQIQRAPIGGLGRWELGGIPLRKAPHAKAKAVSTISLMRQVFRYLATVPDEKNGNQQWVHVELLSQGKKRAKGYFLETDFNLWGNVDDSEIGFITKKTNLRQDSQKSSSEVALLHKNTTVQIIDDVPVNGYIRVQVLAGPNKFKNGYVRADRHYTENLHITAKKAKWHQDKGQDVFGETGVNSETSRLESSKTFTASTSERAEQLASALTASGASALDAFQRVAFILAGQAEGDLETEFNQHTNGSDLRNAIARTFSGKPGKYAAQYLLSILDNNGRPTVKMQVAIPLGLVDSSGAVSAGLVKIPVLGGKIGSLGDSKRIEELLNRATPMERADVMADPIFARKIKKLDKKLKQRLDAQLDVDQAKRIVDSVGPQNRSRAKQQLAITRDKQLGLLTMQHIKILPIPGMVGPLKKHKPKYKFETKKFHDVLVKWKAEATPEDLLQIKRTNSAFKIAFKKIPTNWQMGLRNIERNFILQFLDQIDSSGSEMQVNLAKGSLERQKLAVGRGKSKGWFKTRITGKIAEGKWQSVENEIAGLTVEQRLAFLAEFDPDPATALIKLGDDLKAAGMNKEERVNIRAMFNTNFGDAGGNYIALWELVEPNRRSKLTQKASHFAPSKWSKLGDAMSGKAIGNIAAKIIMGLEGEEFSQVRQDTELMAIIQAHSTPKAWEKILALLGMRGDNDQINGLSTRMTIDTARKHAEFSAMRWAIMLDKAIEENTIGEGVSSGRDKARLFVIASDAQKSARERATGDPSNDPDFLARRFLNEILDALDQLHPKKVKYLQKRVAPVYDAFHENKPIEVGRWIKQAKHEGFGISNARKVDRQKLVWSFESQSGRQLLDEWSNLHEFRSLYTGLQKAEGDIAELNNEMSNVIMRGEKEALLQKRNALMLHMGSIKTEMNSFVLGIHPERRKDFRALGVPKEDRIKMEGMVTDKLIDAMKEDSEVQKALQEVSLPTDKFMQAKMKGVDALEMQRFLNSTRQWHMFSTQGSQLDEATRTVKGEFTTTETVQDVGKQTGKSKKELQKIRKEGAKKAETALEDRQVLEARFRDMQDTFRARAMTLFKLIALGVVTALSAGLAAPLAIGVQLAVEAGLQVAEGLFRYYVLGETNVIRLVVDAGLNMLAATARILTANLASAMNASVLHPDAMGEQAAWLSKPISKSISGTINKVVLFAPNYVVKQLYQDKSLEKVIKEGEDIIGDVILDKLGKQAGAVVGKFAIGALKEYGIRLPKEAVMGAPPDTPPPTQKKFGTAFTDRLAGGSSTGTTTTSNGIIPGTTGPTRTEEQQKMWGRYEKKKKKEVKKQAITAFMTEKKGAHEKKMAGKRRKQWMKELRGKEESSPTLTLVEDVIENHPDLTLSELLDNNHLAVEMLLNLNDKERGEIEELLNANIGDIDLEISIRTDEDELEDV